MNLLETNFIENLKNIILNPTLPEFTYDSFCKLLVSSRLPMVNAVALTADPIFTEGRAETTLFQLLEKFMLRKYGDYDEVKLYTEAGLTRDVFSKIRNMYRNNYKPSKLTVIKLALALELNYEETCSLLYTVGYTLSNAVDEDRIIGNCIKRKIYDVEIIDNYMELWTSHRLFEIKTNKRDLE